jgi:two-component system, cell cycle sensor histidine kinase and response regulator CckA
MKDPRAGSQMRGSETILIVEDEELVRELTSEALQTLGYKVLEAGDPAEAKKIVQNYKGILHLLLTDVVLPQMDGKRLFGELSPLFPEMRVLYVSGYTENAIVHHGVLDIGVHFLQKPFTMDALAKKVRDVLDEP